MTTRERIIKIKQNISPDSLKYAKNTIWALGEKVIRLLAQFVVGVMVARYLEPEKYGILQYAMAFVFIIGSFASLGLREITMRELVGVDYKTTQKIIGSAFFLRVFAALVAMLIIAAMTFVIVDSEVDETQLYIMIISLGVLFQSFDILESFFRARAESKYITYGHTIAIFISSLVKIGLVIFDQDLFYFVLIFAFDNFGFLLPQIYYYIKKGFKVSEWSYDKPLAKKLFLNSYPLMLSAVMITIYASIDQLFIKLYLPFEELGYYSSSVKLLTAFYFIPVAICAALFPRLVEAKDDAEQLKTRLVFLYSLIFWLSVAIFLGLFFFSELIIVGIFSDKFAPAIPSLQVLSFSVTATFMGVATEQYLVVKNYTKISFYRTAAGAIANIILNIILIPKYGIIGAGLATIVSYYIATIALLNMFKETRGQLGLIFKGFNIFYLLKNIKDFRKDL